MRTSICAALAALLAVCVYLPSLKNGFVWDDHILIEANPLFQTKRPVSTLVQSTIGRESGERIEGAARPALVLSLAIDRRLWGNEPAGFHLTNVLLHAANSCLVVLVGASIFSGPGPAIAGALFAVHPINTEAVNAIGFRADLLSAFFILLGCWAFLAFSRRRTWPGRALFLALSAACYGLGLLSKEMAVTLPVLAFAAAWFSGSLKETRWQWRGAALAVYAAVVCGYWVFRLPRAPYRLEPDQGFQERTTLRDAVASNPSPEPIAAFHPSPPPWSALYRDPYSNALTMSCVLGEYLRLLVAPYPLIADRVPPEVRSLRQPRVLLAWALFGILALIAARSRKSRPEISFGILWCFVTLLPVSNIVPMYNPFAERYLYTVSVGASLALAGGLEVLARRCSNAARARLLLAAAVALPYGAWTLRRSGDWRSDETLFEAPRRAESARVHYNLAVLKQREGKLDEAEHEYRRAIELYPEYVESLTNLAGMLESAQRIPEARSLYEKAVALGPKSPLAYDALGSMRLREGRLVDALHLFQAALALDPNYVTARLHEGETYARSGKLTEAVASFSEAQRRDPSRAAAAYNLGMLFDQLRDYARAEGQLKKALSLEPRDRDATMNLGVVYHHQGEISAAKRWLRRAIALDPAYAPAYYNLAMVESDVGAVSEAERDLDAAVRLDPRYGDAWYALGVVRQTAGSRLGAIQAYQKAVDLDPARLEAWTNLGGLLEMSGELAGAQRALDRAYALDPTRPAVLQNVGNLSLRRGKTADAVRYYQEALLQSERWKDAVENRAPIRTNLGLCLNRMGRWKEADAQWRQAIEDNPAYRPAYLALARDLESQGDKEAAADVWRRLLRVSPNDPEALSRLSR